MGVPVEPTSPPPAPSSGTPSAVVLVVVAALVVLLLGGAAAFVALGSDDGDDDDSVGAAQDKAEEPDDDHRPSEFDQRNTSTRRGKSPPTAPPDTADAVDEDGCPTDGETVDVDALPDPDLAAEPTELDVSRQGRISEYPIDPFADVSWPYLGEVHADVAPGEFVDIPLHLDAGEYAVVYSANDCIKSAVQIFAPDGTVVADSTDLGVPGVVEGYEFTDGSDDALTQSGTYVIRVIQHTGVTGGHPIRIYGPEG